MGLPDDGSAARPSKAPRLFFDESETDEDDEDEDEAHDAYTYNPSRGERWRLRELSRSERALATTEAWPPPRLVAAVRAGDPDALSAFFVADGYRLGLAAAARTGGAPERSVERAVLEAALDAWTPATAGGISAVLTRFFEAHGGRFFLDPRGVTTLYTCLVVIDRERQQRPGALADDAAVCRWFDAVAAVVAHLNRALRMPLRVGDDVRFLTHALPQLLPSAAAARRPTPRGEALEDLACSHGAWAMVLALGARRDELPHDTGREFVRTAPRLADSPEAYRVWERVARLRVAPALSDAQLRDALRQATAGDGTTRAPLEAEARARHAAAAAARSENVAAFLNDSRTRRPWQRDAVGHADVSRLIGNLVLEEPDTRFAGLL